MKAKNIAFAIPALLCLAGTACTNLESEVYSAYNSSIFPQTAEDVEALLVGGVYAPFRSNQYEGLFVVNNRGVQTYNDMCTDLADCRWTDTYWFNLINVNFNTFEIEGPTLIYRDNIDNIARMLNIINTIEEMDDDKIDPDRKNELLAEAHCGLGWMAYILYDMYGGIQLISEEALGKPAENIIVPRSSAEQTATFIETHLLEAAKYLPPTIDHDDADYGRFTRGTAYTILMKLYMHDKRWADAVNAGNELMGKNETQYGYELVDRYKDIFTLEGEGNKESIWVCTSDQGINTHLWLAHVLPADYVTQNTTMQKFGGYRMPWQFYRSFEEGDERLEVIAGEYTTKDGVTYNEANPGLQLGKGALPVKYGEDPEDPGSGSAIDFIVLRYADVLTMQAEALARQANAVTQEAVDRLNDVRDRAGLPLKQVSDFASLDDFLDAVLTERGHELWFEGWRRSDLVRHGKFVEYAKLYKNSRTADEHHVLFPLPQQVIDEGRGQVIQNPGY